jgi:hypothetical protein
MKSLFFAISILFLIPDFSHACSMYKITKDGKTIVGNNEDWFSPNSQFWFEKGKKGTYNVMYMGLLNNFAQGAINSQGLVFDGFANDYLEVKNTKGKISVPIGEAVRNIMQTKSNVAEVKAYLETIDLSSLSEGQLVFVDKSGEYLIVEGDELIIGSAPEQCFSNFYYSQIESTDEVDLSTFKGGMKFLEESSSESTLDFTGEVMQSMSSPEGFTQYSTIYDLEKLTVRIYLYSDYSRYVEFSLLEKFKEENHSVMIVDLFPKETEGYQNYLAYNDAEKPTRFLEEMMGDEIVTEEELEQMGFDNIINTVGYEWLMDKENPEGAIEIFAYGTTLLPHNANLFDSLGEAYFKNEEYGKSEKAYKQSLALNPENEGALKMLEEMAGEEKK